MLPSLRISPDIFRDIPMQVIPEVTLRVETARFGPFTFRTGLDGSELNVLILRVDDAHQRFIGTPLSRVASQLEREVTASSVFGTNTIEGGELTENETAIVLQLDPKQVQQEQQRRVVNIKLAYDLAQQATTTTGWQLNLDFIRRVHAAVTHELPHPDNQPGVFRDNPKERVTYVGDEYHGGRYKPPQYGADITLLMEKLIEWHDELVARNVPALVRAPLVHLYYELIHPFWDGNGRVGRVLEATLLQAAGYRYAPFALARFYHEHVDRYFALFNTCRKQADKGSNCPNTPFVTFHIEGMLTVVNTLHDRVNRIVNVLLFENEVRQLLDSKEINARQYTILSQLTNAGRPIPLSELRHTPWYESLYKSRTEKTRQRDLKQLRDQKLIRVDDDSQVWPGFLKPKPK